jgi:hypothetical protein
MDMDNISRLTIKSKASVEENIPQYILPEKYIYEYYKEDNPQVKEVREIFLREKIIQKEEAKKKKETDKRNRAKLLMHNLEQKHSHVINGEEITFDCNGKVVNILGINKKLVKDDFIMGE